LPGSHDDLANAVAGAITSTIGDGGLEVFRRLGMPYALPTAAPQPTEVAVHDPVTGLVRYVPAASLRPASAEGAPDAG
jgi:hypothetical protein